MIYTFNYEWFSEGWETDDPDDHDHGDKWCGGRFLITVQDTKKFDAGAFMDAMIMKMDLLDYVFGDDGWRFTDESLSLASGAPKKSVV